MQEWGRQAARNVAVVRGRMNLMLRSMTPEDRSKAEAWFDELPAAQAGLLDPSRVDFRYGALFLANMRRNPMRTPYPIAPKTIMAGMTASARSTVLPKLSPCIAKYPR